MRRTTHRRGPSSLRRGGAAAVALVALAACGSTSSSSAGAAAPAGSPSSAAASSPASAGGAGTGCKQALEPARNALAAASSAAAVVKVEMGAGCDVSITANLPNDQSGAAVAQGLCEAVAKVAYAAGANSITVTGPDGHDLALGIASKPCVSEALG